MFALTCGTHTLQLTLIAWHVNAASLLAFRRIKSERGLRGLYTGHTVNVAREVRKDP